VGGAELGPAEDVDEVDRPVHVEQRRCARDAEHLVAVRPHRDAVVALREQVAHHAVALAVRRGRGSDDRDRLRVAQQLERISH
jgi:hypothetical protein